MIVPKHVFSKELLDQEISLIFTFFYDAISQQTWEDFRNEIMNVFGSKQSYSLDEKLTLLRSLHKGPGEDVWAYLVRVRCAVSQILHNCVPTNLEETPDMGHSLVQV